jgi:hypothetical protein
LEQRLRFRQKGNSDVVVESGAESDDSSEIKGGFLMWKGWCRK